MFRTPDKESLPLFCMITRSVNSSLIGSTTANFGNRRQKTTKCISLKANTLSRSKKLMKGGGLVSDLAERPDYSHVCFPISIF